MPLPPAEPYRIKVVEPIRRTTREERRRLITEVGYNLFLLRAEDVYIDLLTDSGTGAMSDRQWGALMTGDESYAGSRSFYHLRDAVAEVLGFPYTLPTHQGRGAEHLLFNVLVRPGQHVIGNMHFDTTRAHIEHRRGVADDLPVEEAYDPTVRAPFKGDLDLAQAEALIGHMGRRPGVADAPPVEEAYDPTVRAPFKGDLDLAQAEALIGDVGRGAVALVLMTVTCNGAGGQPVSMANLRAARALADRHGLPLFLDAARIAENAFFIKRREPGYAQHSIAAIVHEMCDLADGCTFSGKKDALVNIG